jgi:hypothetical protein
LVEVIDSTPIIKVQKFAYYLIKRGDELLHTPHGIGIG